LLSCFRIAFSALLLLFCDDTLQERLIFTLLYFAIAITDALDGFLARRYHWESKLGAKLDGLGDLTIFIFGFICLMFLLPVNYENPTRTLLTLGVAIALKAFSFVLTRVRFKEWNMMHTLLNKFLGAALYCAVPVFMWLRSINYWFVLAISIVAAISVLEDTVILFTADHYDADHKGLLFEKIAARRGKAA
jgi:CDP-diacylglycerol--glycerol-3-phosphate 3-phosphatidyltransferase